MTELPPLDRSVLPDGIRARFVERVNGLRVHILEAGVKKVSLVTRVGDLGCGVGYYP